MLGGDCFVAALLAMTTICHREPRRGVAISSCPDLSYSIICDTKLGAGILKPGEE